MAAPAATNNNPTPPEPPPAANAPADSISADELAAKAANKRYEGLVMVRTKAIRGKGAWYWAHLEPVLVKSTDTGLPKAVKLRCSLCDSVFSASNPSRTASEHLKRGTCPNFASSPNPISAVSPVPPPDLLHQPPPPPHNSRKRSSAGSGRPHSYPPPPPLEASPHQQHQLVLSGGKDDLGALALLEDSVKKLKSPKTTSPPPAPALTKAQVDLALDYLADWVFDSGGSVSISSLDHPKFRSFLNQVGLPSVSKRDFACQRLDAKYEEARLESGARIRDAMFFQISSDGWKQAEGNLVNLTLNLPNGTTLYQNPVFITGPASSSYAEEILSETVSAISSGNSPQRCSGIVADKFKGKALRNLEDRYPWMVNLPCQLQGIRSLTKDFSKELPLFQSATRNCLKLAKFVNDNPRIRKSFHKYQLQEYGHGSGLLRLPPKRSVLGPELPPAFATFEDVLGSARAVQLAILDESNEVAFMEDPAAGEVVSEMVRDRGFWNELEAVHALTKLVDDVAREVEAERPLVGQCLPLWEDVRNKVKDWCAKYRVSEGPVEKAVERRFRKNYHPAWAAAFVLDPLYLARDSSGSSYLPPFNCLTTEQEKDVDRLITRLVARDEAHVALMELMKWRTSGLDPMYARAVQMKEPDPVTGKLRIVNPQSRRLVWETHLSEFRALGKVAVRLIFLRAVASCGQRLGPLSSYARWAASSAHGPTGLERARRMIFVAAHSKLERRDPSSDEGRDLELFGLANGDEDVLNDVLVDATSQ